MILNRNRAILLVLTLLVTLFVTNAQESNDLQIDDFVVTDTITLGLVIAPENSGGYLAPDGSRLALLNERTFCFYTLPDGIETFCYQLTDKKLPQADTVKWSPDSRYITFTDHNALALFQDSDIWVIDSFDGSATNLTQDDFDGDLRFDPIEGPSVFIDLQPAWIDNATIAFVRYAYSPEVNDFLTAELYAVAVDGGQANLIHAIAESTQRMDVLYLDWLEGTRQYAFNQFRYAADPRLYQWFLADDDEHTTDTLLIDTDRDSRAARTTMIDIAPNGEAVLHYNAQSLATADLPGSPQDSMAAVTRASDLTTLFIDPDRKVTEAGWAPDGDGLIYTVLVEPDAGLFVTHAAGEPGRMILPGQFRGTTSTHMQPLQWASNDSVLITDTDNRLILVLIGAK